MALSARTCASLLLLFSILSAFVAQTHAEEVYIYGTDGSGVTRQLAANRYPALYTGDFGDCLGGQSLFNITKFDAAYYADNLTIVFHLDGTSNIKNESLMMNIAVEAYGTSRFEQTFDPCSLNIYSLCPLNASVPVTGWAVIPVGPQQIGGIPPIAFDIPDFEGSTKLQIFANSSKTEIGCFQAVMRNGNSFSHPEAVAPVLGIFTVVAIVASFATAAYGVSIAHMRMHHAHSLSVLVVFETFQAIFFSGALSVNWPSVCLAWWSNFAWSAGLIYSDSMIRSIDSFAGVTGNASQVGGAGSVVINNGGGLIAQIYGRSLAEKVRGTAMKRSAYNASNPYDYTWSGDPVTPGMPLPGTRHGFPATLATVGIPSADAFLVALIWLVIAIGLVAASVAFFKLLLEGLARAKWIKEDRLGQFRSDWTVYLASALLRTCFIGFSMVMTLAVYQFAIHGSAGAVAVAAVVFLLFLAGITSLVAYACRSRTRLGKFEFGPDRLVFHRTALLKAVPFLIPARLSTVEEHGLEVRKVLDMPFFRIRHINDDPAREAVHKDKEYVKRFGWLSAKYRRTRWWFFAYYIVYQFVRAAFIGGGVQNPLAQVYGLLIFELISFAVLISLNPFEGARNTAMAVWILSISKIATTGLSIAFLPAFALDRIIATALGVVIIVIQGLSVIALLVLITLSAISSWMSLTRNREEFEPEWLEAFRVRYFEKMEEKALDEFQPHQPKKDKGKGKEVEQAPPPPAEPYFAVVSVRRAPKIEDEDGDVVGELDPAQNGSAAFDPSSIRGVTRPSRANSVNSRHSVGSLPRLTRAPRGYSKEFAQWEADLDHPDSVLGQRASSSSTFNHNGSTGMGDSHVANSSMATGSAPVVVRPQSSSRSLRTPAGTRPSSPVLSPAGRNTPTRETLARHADERRFPTPQPTIPDLQ
ncbi:TRP-domain-containing protein [Diplogelasinospora grovesii]|uniref:TRP-domain-containing protein n=1 Tax=Diplogelasinospora grovesii TaxID=303347 RepID=A0AAN6S652_9PEZI|nr:TRP-domain-containing protein [Diplogelasinospora grovesii]